MTRESPIYLVKLLASSLARDGSLRFNGPDRSQLHDRGSRVGDGGVCLFELEVSEKTPGFGLDMLDIRFLFCF